MSCCNTKVVLATGGGLFFLAIGLLTAVSIYYDEKLGVPVDIQPNTDSLGHVTVCLELGRGIYDTRQVSQLDANVHVATGLATRGSCNCGLLCFYFHSFRTTGHRCTCYEHAATQERQSPTATSLQRKLLPDDFFDDAMDLGLYCTRSTDQCNKERRCPSNQVCRLAPSASTTGGQTSCQCKPVTCANRFGNPCGPDQACRDTPSGYACTSILSSSRACPMSCGPHAQCLPTLVNGTNLYSCLCNTGYIRLAPYLACTSAPITSLPVVAPSPAPQVVPLSPPLVAPKAPVAPPKVVPPPQPVAPQSPIAAPKAPAFAPTPPLPTLLTVPIPPITAPKAPVIAPKAPATIVPTKAPPIAVPKVPLTVPPTKAPPIAAPKTPPVPSLIIFG